MHRLVAILLALGLALPGVAFAKAEKTLDYTYGSIWSSAIRFLRADRGYPIKDKDRENGYILFVYPGTGSVKECTASLEIIPVVDDQGFQRIKVNLSIQHQPSYLEVHLLDNLEQKLRDELGPPPAPRKAPQEKDGKDSKKEKDKDKEKEKEKDRDGRHNGDKDR
jgi:hypothetical protein